MNHRLWSKKSTFLLAFILIYCSCFADNNLFQKARSLQRSGDYEGAIVTFKSYLLQPIDEEEFGKEQIIEYSDALMQLMNTFQSKGEPESCISTLQELYDSSPILQKQCLRDYYSVMGYALSRTEKMKAAEETTLKVFTIPLQQATPERFFRDYAYAAAVFYSNPDYQREVIDWCQEALQQAKLCKNTSGKQWVTAMLGSLYKRNGHINEALTLFQQSKEEAQERGDNLGVLNSLHAMIDLFLYWDIPEYANIYASEAIRAEESMATKNPMISAQTYINKGRALLQLGEIDSVAIYAAKAKEICQSLPYNSGMVDVDLLHGTYLTEKGGDSLHLGIQELQQVTRQGTAVNRAKAFHQLGLLYLRNDQSHMAEIMLDSMYSLLNQSDSPIYIHVNYKPILNYYLQANNQNKVEQYIQMMLQEQQALKDKRLNFNLVEAIAESQNAQQRQELKILQLEQANQRLWFLVCVVLSIIVISATILLLVYQRRQHKQQMKRADNKLARLAQKLHQASVEKAKIAQEINELMNDKDSRQELETLTPTILQKNGETKFRQRFELLYPHFLPRLREKVPAITRREELLSMLIVLKQDNKEIAELLAIAPRSVLMLRHRFRQKIGIIANNSLEDFIEETLEP
jgi:DNA-binding CsgD family transcriptional regulator